MSRLVAIFLAASACSRTPAPHVTSITVDAFEGGEVVSMSAEQLRQRLQAQLTASKFVLVSPPQQPPEGVTTWRVELAAGLADPDAESESVDVQVVMHLSPRGGDAEAFEVRAHDRRKVTSNEVAAIQELVRQALDTSLGSTVAEAKALIELSGAKDEVVVARLGGDAPARSAAIRLLARRKHRAALAPLLERLKSEELLQVRGAIGLLVELGAGEAVNPMIEAAGQRGPVVQREVLFAISAIGGDDAEAYLDLVGSGHEDPAMRAVAEQALAELRQRKRPKPNGDAQ